jgi:hypothetical protein
MNGLTAQRRNRMLKDMAYNIICNAILSPSLWGGTLNTASYILNVVPTKATNKPQYDFG